MLQGAEFSVRLVWLLCWFQSLTPRLSFHEIQPPSGSLEASQDDVLFLTL